MSKRYNIRWTDKDEKNLKRVVKNFNAKVDRLIKENPEFIKYYPKKLSYKKIRKGSEADNTRGIKTRADLNRTVNSISRFSRRGVEKIVTSKAGTTRTKYEFKEASIKTGVINRARTMKAKKLGIDIKEGNLGQLESENLLPKRPVEDIPEDSFNDAIIALEIEIASTYDHQRKMDFRDNYIRAIEKKLGEFAPDIIHILMQVDLDTFVREATSNPFVVINFIYNKIDQETIADSLYTEWESFI